VKKPVIASFLLILCLLVSALICPTVSANTQQVQVKKYIAFRDDDVKPFVPLDALKAVNQVHIDENVPVTLGIIPHRNVSREGNQLLQDDQFLSYMRSIATNPLFEFAQHGYLHNTVNVSSPGEFNGTPYEDQYNYILKGRNNLVEAFGRDPKTFIPPWNNGDNNTERAAASLGFTHYSVGTPISPLRYVDGMQVETSITIGEANGTDFSKTLAWAQNYTESFLADPGVNTLTVTYHTWSFLDGSGAVDNHRVQQLKDFIVFLKAKGVLFTRLDRSSMSGEGVVVSPSPRNGLAYPTSVGGNPSGFLIVSSIGVVLSGIYVSARPQGETKNKKED